MAAIALVFTVLIAMNPGVARDVSQSLKTAVCRAVHLECGTPSSVAGPTSPCLVSQNNSVRAIGVKLAIVKIDSTQTMTTETYSDGSVRITAVTNGGLGGTIGAPEGEVKISLGKSSYGVGWNADLSATANAESGRTWYFPNQAAADKFKQQVSDEVASERRSSWNPIGFIPIGGISGNTFGDAGQWADAAGHLTPPTTVYEKAGVKVNGSAGAYGGPAYVAGKAELRGYLGQLVNNKTGDRTMLFDLGGNLEGGGGIFTLAGNAKGDVNVQVAVTADAHGNPTTASIIVTGKGSVSQLAGLNAKTVPEGVLGALKQVNLGGTDNGMFQVKASVPLNDPQTQRQLADVLSGNLGRLPDLATTVDHNATVTVNTYTGDGSSYGLEGEVGDGFVVGANGSFDTSNLKLSSANYYDPARGGFYPWTSCKP